MINPGTIAVAFGFVFLAICAWTGSEGPVQGAMACLWFAVGFSTGRDSVGRSLG